MNGLVVFCLFGDDPEDVYYRGAAFQADLYRKSFPEWDLWFYMGKSVPDSVVEHIFSKNNKSVFEFMDGPENQTSTYWRMQAVFHSNHDFILFRDVDSRLCNREIAAVNEWLQSGYHYHTMRDHPYHGRPFLAGLWGLKKTVFHEVQGIPTEISQNEDFYGVDQIALQLHVWPQARRKTMAHIGCSANIFERVEQRRPFTVPRLPGTFVGQGVKGDGTPRYPGHEKLVESDYSLRQIPEIFLEEYRVPKPLSA